MADKKESKTAESQNKSSDEAVTKTAEETEARNVEVREALKHSNDPPRTVSTSSD